MKKLTKRQEKFVQEYLKGWNGTQAAEAAGYSYPMQAAHLLFNTKCVTEAIAERLAEAAMQSFEVLSRLSQMARLNIADFYLFGWVDRLQDGNLSSTTRGKQRKNIS